MSTTLFLINPIVSKSGARLFAPNFWDDTNRRRRRRNSTGRENNTARLVRPPPFHLQTSTTREGEPPDRVTAEREREREREKKRVIATRNEMMMEERNARKEKTEKKKKKRKEKKKEYLVFASAALLDDAHFGRFRCHDEMCFIIGCECDEIRKVTIVFFFFSLRHHHREVASQPLISHPPLSFLLLFLYIQGLGFVFVCFSSDTHKKRREKGRKRENKVEKRLNGRWSGTHCRRTNVYDVNNNE